MPSLLIILLDPQMIVGVLILCSTIAFMARYRISISILPAIFELNVDLLQANFRKIDFCLNQNELNQPKVPK